MTFSESYVFLWMLITVLLSWIIPRSAVSYFLALSGITFLGVFDWVSLIILCVSSLIIFYGCSYKKHLGKFVVVVIALLSSLFVYFKLCQLSNHNSLVIPLGLSYFLFRQVHYIFERYKNTLRSHSLIEYLSYLCLVPLTLVGPIHRFPNFLNDLRRRRWEWDVFSLGLERMFLGYAKLIILANFLIANHLKDYLYQLAEQSGPALSAWIKSFYMWVDLYIRFSAYSDIAIGISAMMGFKILENFRSPFLAVNISDFWSRWHISLTGWCTEYIFKPVAALTRKPGLAIGATMLAIGLWHEFSFRYVLWGFYHAVGIAIYKNWRSIIHKVTLPQSWAFQKLSLISARIITLIFVISSFPVTTWLQSQITSIF